MKTFLKNLVTTMRKDPTSEGFISTPEGFITLDDSFYGDEEDDGLNVHQFSHKETELLMFPIGR